jgi:cell wall-associated NlpC family hydrolase
LLSLTATKKIPHYLCMWIKKALLTIALLLIGSISQADEVSEQSIASGLEDAQPASATWSDRTQELIFHALAFIDVKYRYGGVSPETGWDCSGYVYHVFREAVGVILPRDAASMSAKGQPISRRELQPGDLVFFNTLKRAFSHVGIYLGDNRFIHAPATGKAVQISNMASEYWARRYDGGRRIALVEE